MRAFFTQKDLDKMFDSLKDKLSLTWIDIAKKYNISVENMRAWRTQKISIPVIFINDLEKLGIKIPPHTIKSLSYIKTKCARKGGLRRIQLYGNPGTSTGRSLGGKRSVKKSHEKKYNLTESKELSEFIGIMLGDGHINKNYLTITLHKIDDRDYAYYIQRLMIKIFNIKSGFHERKNVKALILQVSRAYIIRALKEKGLYISNKVKNQVSVPEWINSSIEYKKTVLKGLFDTDGCFYIDRHKRGNKLYFNAGMSFTNHSKPLLDFFKGTLEEIGYHPTCTKFNVSLRREKEILRYFEEIKTNNPKHRRRFEDFFRNKRKGTEEVITAQIRNLLRAQVLRGFESLPFRT